MTAGERSVELADGRRRFFIVTAGRTGSSLLATILAEAGADFGMPPQEQWDVARGGSMEHEEIRRASHHFLRAFDRSPVKPPGALSKLIWSYHRDAGKRHLKRALAGATYFKALNLDLAIPFAIKLGYFPQVIVNYRPFEEQVVSLSQMLISWSAATLAAAHNRTYQNALLLVHSYGGCVVSYADLTDRRRTEWAASLAAITGLPAEKLLAGRDRRTSAKETAGESIPVLDDTAQDFSCDRPAVGPDPEPESAGDAELEAPQRRSASVPHRAGVTTGAARARPWRRTARPSRAIG